jgi:hypothetical protein
MNVKKPSTDKNIEADKAKAISPDQNKKPREFGGQEGPEPTRYGDWEKGGRCTDF